MNTPHIRHAWFPPTIPKRKHSIELDAESEWPNTYRALSSGPTPPIAPRPAKRLRALEGGLAGLTLDVTGGWKTEPAPPSASPPEVIVSNAPSNPSLGQVHDNETSISEAEPYISSIYEYASPYPTTTGSSVVSLPLRGEVSEASASDEERDRERDVGRETVVSVGAQHGMPGYVVYEPEGGLEKRKRGDLGMDEDEVERSCKAGKKKWFEPEKDRIVVLDLESSEDESITRSPRRRRSAFSLATSSSSTPSSPQKENPAGRPRSQTDADGTEYVINPALLSHLSPTNTVGKPIIPREEDPGKAVVLFRPAPWDAGAPTLGSESGSPTTETQNESRAEDEVVEMEASPLVEDEDAMDVDP